MNGGAWWATFHGIVRVGHDLATESLTLEPVNNVVVISGGQQGDSAIHKHESILPQTPPPVVVISRNLLWQKRTLLRKNIG